MKPDTKDRLKSSRKSLAQLAVGIIVLVAVFAGIIWYDEREDTDHAGRARIAMDVKEMSIAMGQFDGAENDIGYFVGCIYNSMQGSLEGNASSAVLWYDDAGKFLVTAMMLFDDAHRVIRYTGERMFVDHDFRDPDSELVRSYYLKRDVYVRFGLDGCGARYIVEHDEVMDMDESVKQHRKLEPQYRALLNGTEKTVAATRHLSNYRTLMNTSGCSREVALYELGLARVEIDEAADVFTGVREGCYSDIWNATHTDERFAVDCDERKSLVCQTAAECEKVVDEIQEVIYNETKNNR